MSFSRSRIVLIIAAFLANCIGYGLEPASIQAKDSPTEVAGDSDGTTTAELPKHFILNPDDGRPLDYPAAISLKQLEAFLKTQRMTGQGCGGGTWEGAQCGMFSNTYAATKTPWLNDEAELDAHFAMTKTGTFLAGITLGRNTYDRADRNSDKLVWKKNYQPEYEEQEIRQIIFGTNSAERKMLLIKIMDSFQNRDLAQFPAARREELKRQLQRCENDRDPTVVTLAQELRKALTLSNSQP